MKNLKSLKVPTAGDKRVFKDVYYNGDIDYYELTWEEIQNAFGLKEGLECWYLEGEEVK